MWTDLSFVLLQSTRLTDGQTQRTDVYTDSFFVGPRRQWHSITSHHTEKTEAGLKGLYIREITTIIDLLIRY